MDLDPAAPRPFIKWAGGKQALAAELVKVFPPRFNAYYEPFLGGGSVFFALKPRNAQLSDSNGWLIDTYKAVRRAHLAVARTLDTLKNNREAFLEIRGTDPTPLKDVQRAAHFIYLNKTCFRGLFRVNRYGKFNVPYGNYQRRYYNENELAAAASALKHAKLETCDFADAVASARSGDFVYLDPPYHKLGGYSDFNRYTAMQFKETDHHRLKDVCQDLTRRGVLWALSNSDTTMVRKLFKGFEIQPVKARREINLSSANRDIGELVITNYPRSGSTGSTHEHRVRA